MKKRISILLVFLIISQIVMPQFSLLHTGFTSEKAEGELFDFDNLSEDAYTEDGDDLFVEVNWSLEDYQLDENDRTVEFSSPLKFIDQKGTLSLDDDPEIILASYTTSEDTVVVDFDSLAFDYSDAKGTVKLALNPDVINEEEKLLEEDVKTEAIDMLDTNEQRDLGNIFTFEYLRINNEFISDGDIIEITEGTIANLRFTWDTEGENAKAGDTASIRLSDAFEIVSTPIQNIEVDGIIVGTYNVENGVLKFVFNEEIENDDVQNGYVDLGLEFNMSKFRENIEQQIPFHDGDENNITVTAKPNLNHEGINKAGRPDSQHDAREITWTIDVINTSDEAITEATLADNIPDGLGEAREFVINELSVGYDGDIRQGSEVTSTFNPTAFPIKLGTVAPYKGYRVQYTTTIEDYAAESFTNDATFEYDDVTLPADTTVGGLTRSDAIEKNGWRVGQTDQIQWVLSVNKSGQYIDEAIVDEVLPEGLSFAEDSMEIYRNGQQVENIEIPAEGFPINLGELTPSDEYEIRFKTDIEWSEVNNGEYLQDNKFNNEAILKNGEITVDEADAEVSFGRQPILNKSGISNVKYEDKTVTWTIDVNEARHPLKDVELTDLIPEGLAITKDDIVITDVSEDPEVLFRPENIRLESVAGGTKVVINLNDVGTRQLKVEYTTEITDFTINHFNNGVGMTGDGIGPDGEEDTANISPAGNTYTKNYVGIDYNEKTIDWRVNVDPVREDIKSGFVITDTFTNDGLILLPNTVEVRLGGTELVLGTDYELAPINNGYQNGFTITFDRVIADGELVVTYTTSYDPETEVDGEFLIPHSNEDEIRLYRNKAEFDGTTDNGNPIDQEDDASHRVREDSWNTGKKEGQLVHIDDEDNVNNDWVSGAERKIAWQLYINYLEQDLGTGVVVTDTLEYAGEIDEDSIQVSVYEVDTDGETTISGPVLEPSHYTVNTDEDGQFILTFADGFEVNERYVIEFTTSVPDLSLADYTNKAIVSAGGVDYDYSATLNYDKHDDYLTKRAVDTDGNRVFTGDEVEWEVRVNESLSIIQNPVITDTISAGHVYLEGTLEIYKSQDLENQLQEETDYTLEVVPVLDDNDEPTGATDLIITMTEDLEDSLVLNYTTVVTATDGHIGNSISIEGEALEQQTIESGQVEARQFSSVGGQWSRSRGAIRLTKIDAEEEQTIDNNEATFELWYDLNGDMQRFGEDVYSTENGTLEIGNLPFRTYYLRESKAPEGYVLSEEDLEIVVDTAIGPENNPIYAEAVFENTKEKIDVTGTKNWFGGEVQRPDSIELQLYRNGEEYDEPVRLDGTEADSWQYTWTDLDRTDIDGNAYDYTIDEVDVPENFVQTVSDDGLSVTNTFESPLIDITVKKEWLDNGSEDRPTEITIDLLRNGEINRTVQVTAEDDWTYVFENLREFDENGALYEYTIEEHEISGYQSTIDEFNITNVRVGTVVIEGEKIWLDNEDATGDRPDTIEVILNRNGEEFARQTVTATNDWAYSFTGLDEFDEEGVAYTYSVEEVVPTGYEASYSDNDITNLRTGTTEVSGEKIWLDNDDATGDRPNTIEVILNRNGEEFTRQTVTATNDWTYSFTGLDEFDEEGVAYTYSVEEVVPTGYEASYSDNAITNLRTGMIEVSGEKTWLDNDDATGDRPESIEVILIQNGEEFARQTVTATDGWAYTFTELPEFDDRGIAHTYTVEEVVPTGYIATYTGTNITNLRTGTVNVDVTKTWQDDNEADRPDEITVNLLQNGIVINTQDITADMDWSYSFSDLAEFDDEGVAYVYTVSEHDVPGYDSEVDGYEITNTRSEERDITVTKSWLDDDAEGRPTEITIDLLRNGEVDQTVQITAEEGWEYVFENLPAYDEEGQAYAYSIEEHEVEGYQTTINGFDLTNLRVGTVEFEGTKTWLDNDDATGDRPEEIVVLLINQYGEEVARQTVTEADDWSYDFTDIAEFDDQGVAFEYRIEEIVPEGYQASYSGNDITNLRTGTIDISGEKTWLDNNDATGDRPESIEVILTQNGEEFARETVTEADNWAYTFAELPEFDDQGIAYTYNVLEEVVPNGYQVFYTGTDITNLRTGSVDVNVTKTWRDDDAADRPDEITVNLLQNGILIGTQTITADMKWSYSFTDLPEFDEDGVAFEYTVSEHDVPGYQSQVDGYNITNTRSEERDITVTKSWLNDDSADRPTEITIDLLRNEEVVQTIQVTAESGWTYTFENLPAYDEEGQAYAYSIEEHEVEGYETTVDGFDITNTKIDEDTPEDLASEEDDEDTLPKTATNMFNFMLISLFFLVSGLGMYIINNRRKRSSD